MSNEHFRGCKEWRDEGLPLSTASDEAAKLFDAALSQYIAFREFESHGGLQKTLENMLKADPEFVLGQIFVHSTTLLWSSISPCNNPNYGDQLSATFHLASKSKDLTTRERSYVDALEALRDGFYTKAREIWEQIQIDNPTDALALKLLHDGCILSGDKRRLTLLADRAFSGWKTSQPQYNYLYGIKAFALCENGDYHNSELTAKKGLELIPTDVWATHALTHDYEMTGQSAVGQKFLEDTVKLWEPSNGLVRHIHWHNAVFSVEMADYEKALGIFEDKVLPGLDKSAGSYDFVDACSLLYRLQLQGLKVRDMFGRIYERCLGHLGDRWGTFSDLHNVMAVIGSGHEGEARKFCDDLKLFVSSHQGDPTKDYVRTSARVGVPLTEAMLAFDAGRYAEAVDRALPCLEDVVAIGGSDAQRDVFTQFFLNAAVNSSNPEHRELAENLLKRRKESKVESPLTERLLVKLLNVGQKLHA